MSTQEDHLTEIADAIREKEGTAGEIAANTFAARIRAIPSTRSVILFDHTLGGFTVNGAHSSGDSTEYPIGAGNGVRLTDLSQNMYMVVDRDESGKVRLTVY